MNLNRNLGQMDRVLRLGGGALLVALAALGVVGVWGYLGLILVATGFMNFCPIYRVLGLRTCQDC